MMAPEEKSVDWHETKIGIDNPGFEEDNNLPPVAKNGSVYISLTPTSNSNGSFLNVSTVDTSMLTEVNLKDSDGSIERKKTKKDKEVAEAVNLELVNMNPFSSSEKQDPANGVNGIPLKKESEENGESYTDPYDEYFVPVNEHRKYIRGEKLYVTKDKRRSQSWKRCVCWGIGFVLLATAILIAVLAGTGVILAQEEAIVGDGGRQFGSSDARIAGVGNIGLGKQTTTTDARPESSSLTPPPPSPPPVPGMPTTEMSQLYVPRSVEGELVIDNMEYTHELQDPNTEEFKRLSTSLEDVLKRALFDHQTLTYGAANIFLKTLQFTPGSVVAKFRIGWQFKEGIRNPGDPINMDSVRQRLEEKLNKNGRFLDTFHLSLGSIRTNNVIDLCQFNNGECSHECIFDYQEKLNFVCVCPSGLQLDSSGKNCTEVHSTHQPPEAVPEPGIDHPSISEVEGHHITDHPASPEPVTEHGLSPSPEPEPVTEHGVSPSPEPEPVTEHEVSPSPEPEPVTEHGVSPSPEPEPEPITEHEVSLSPKPEPEPVTEHGVSPSPEPEPEPEPITEHEGSLSPKPEPEPVTEHRVSPSPEPEPEPEPITEHEVSLSPKPEPEPVTEHGVSTSPKPNTEHEIPPSPRPEPITEHEVFPTPEPEPVTEHELLPSPEPRPYIEHVTSSSPKPEPMTEHMFYSSELEQGPKHEVLPTPEPEPVTEHEVLTDHSILEAQPHPSTSRTNDVYSVHHNDIIAPEHVGTTPSQITENEHNINFPAIHEFTEYHPPMETTMNPNMDTSFENNMRHIDMDIHDHTEMSKMTESVGQSHNTNMMESMINKVMTTTMPESETSARENSDVVHQEIVDEDEMMEEMTTHEPSTMRLPIMEAVPGPLSKDDLPVDSTTMSNTDYGQEFVTSHHSSNDEKTENYHNNISESPTTSPSSVIKKQEPNLASVLMHSEESIDGSNNGEESNITENTNESLTNTAEEPSFTVQDVNKSMSLMESEARSNNNNLDIAMTTNVPDMVTTNVLLHGLSKSEKDMLRNANEEHTTVNMSDEISTISPIHQTEWTETKNNRSLLDNDMFPVSENDTFINALSPDDYVFNTFDTSAMAEKNNTKTMDNHSLKKTPRLDDDEMHERNPNDKDPMTLIETVPMIGDENITMTTAMPVNDLLDNGYITLQLNDSKSSNTKDKSKMKMSPGSEIIGNNTNMVSEEQLEDFNHIHVEPGLRNPNYTITNKNPTKVLVNDMMLPFPRETTTEDSTEHMSTIPPDMETGFTETMYDNTREEAKDSKTNIENTETISVDVTTIPTPSDQSPTTFEATTLQPDDGNTSSSGENSVDEYVTSKSIENSSHVSTTTIKSQMENVLNESLSRELNDTDQFLNSVDVDKLTVHDLNLLKYGHENGTDIIGSAKEVTPMAGDITMTTDTIMSDNDSSTPGNKSEVIDKEPMITLQATVNDFNRTVGKTQTDPENEDVTTTDKQLGITESGTNKTGITGRGSADKTENDIKHNDFLDEYHMKHSQIYETSSSLSNTASTTESPALSENEANDSTVKLNLIDTASAGLGSSTTENSKFVDGLATVKSATELNNSSVTNPTTEFSTSKELIHESSEEDLENKLVVDFDRNQGSSISSTTEHVNSVEALQSSAEANVIPPTSQSIVLIDPITGEIQQMNNNTKSTRESSTETRNDIHDYVLKNTGNTTPIFVVDKPLTDLPFLKTEHKKKDLNNNINNKKLFSPSDSNTSDENDYFGKGILNNYEKKDKPQKFDKENNKKIDKIGLAAPIDGEEIEDQIVQVSENIDTTTNLRDVRVTAVLPTETTQSTPSKEGKVTPPNSREDTFDELDENEDILSTFANTKEKINIVEEDIDKHNKQDKQKKKEDSQRTTKLDDVVVNSATANGSEKKNEKIVQPDINIHAIGLEPAFPINQNETLSTSTETRMIPEIESETENLVPEENEGTSQSDELPVLHLTEDTLLHAGLINDASTTEGLKPSTEGIADKNKPSEFLTSSTETKNLVKNNQDEINKPVLIELTTIMPTNSMHINDETTMKSEPKEEESTIPTISIQDLLQSNKTHNSPNKNISAIEGTESVTPIHQIPVMFSKCTAGQFQCVNGTSQEGEYCVSWSAKCDSANDCSDGSDELGCIVEGCPGNFQCANGQCLKRHLVCNGIVDCNDSSDEVNCENWQCQFDEFQCPSGRCIPVLWQCDGKQDCGNHTDEFNCQTSCKNDEYLCPEGWCIPMTWRCNGVPECDLGDDEKLCDCSLDQFKCQTGGCVMKSQVCDGVEHCPDFSDEWDCIRIQNDTMRLEIRTSIEGWHPVCSQNWDTQWSNLVCQNLGYSKASFTDFPPSGTNDTSYYELKPRDEEYVGNDTPRLMSFLQQAENNSVCSSGAFVEISCQDFTCGSHSIADGVAARLVGGDGATNGQWPSVALLYHTKFKVSCTASIISPKWLMSSYNCLHLRDKSLTPNMWVAFGGGSMFETFKPETQIKEVRSITTHPQVKYNQFLYNNDIALIELTEPLLFTRYVGAICLPEKEIEPRQLCVTAGWGYTSPGEINFSQYLHYLPVPTIDLRDCNSTKHYAGFITDDDICAGFTDAEKSACYNDEGAPLMCVNEGGVWELQGILSYHSNCGRGYHPSIFSSITAVRGWVEKTVGSKFERKSTFNVRRR